MDERNLKSRMARPMTSMGRIKNSNTTIEAECNACEEAVDDHMKIVKKAFYNEMGKRDPW